VGAAVGEQWSKCIFGVAVWCFLPKPATGSAFTWL
jgi:hypothetical protein